MDGALSNAKHSADRTANWIIVAPAIGDGLEVIIVLLMPVEDSAVTHLLNGEGGHIGELDAGGTEEGELLGNERDCIRSGPKGVLDAGVGGVMVIAPFAFAKTLVTAQKSPVTEGSSVAIGGRCAGARNDLDHHGVVDHFTTNGHMLIFLDGISHEGNIVIGHPKLWGQELAIGVTAHRLGNVTH
jgi:hypothetical protein